MAPALRAFHHRDFPAESLVEAKGGRFLSVCLPARDEEATVGKIVDTICEELVDRVPLVDEVLVVDDGSADRTAVVAAEAGATVVAADEVLPGCGRGEGKGEALWKALGASKGDVLAFCDADVRDFQAAFVTGLLGPLLLDPEIAFVKGFYARALDGVAGEGGRVTELVARPLLSLLFPQLSGVVQPLAGEFAARREVLEQVPFVQGYGVDLGLLLDVSGRFGVDALAQVDLGTRTHRNRPLDELAPQALAVLWTGLERAGVPLEETSVAVLERPGRQAATVAHRERPPIVEAPGYRRRGEAAWPAR